MAKALSKEDGKQAARMYAEGSSVEEIGAWLGCGSRAVQDYLEQTGVIGGRAVPLTDDEAARREIAADKRLARALAALEERYVVALRRRV